MAVSNGNRSSLPTSLQSIDERRPSIGTNSDDEDYIVDNVDYGNGAGANEEKDDYNQSRAYSITQSFLAETDIGWRDLDKDDAYKPLKEKHPEYRNREEKYEYLNKSYMIGTKLRDRQSRESLSDKPITVETLASQLGIHGHFVDRAAELLLQFETNKVGTEHPTQKAALAALALVHDGYFKEHWELRSKIPQEINYLSSRESRTKLRGKPLSETKRVCQDGSEDPKGFRDLMDEFELTETELKSIQRKLISQTDFPRSNESSPL